MQTGTINDVAIENRKNNIYCLVNAYIAVLLLVLNKRKVIILITKVRIDLKNCYGIKKLKEDLDFDKNPVVAIYAPQRINEKFPRPSILGFKQWGRFQR